MCTTRVLLTRQKQTLLDNDLSLFAYHLPLDAHPQLGNNVQLGEKLGFRTEADLDPFHKSRPLDNRIFGFLGFWLFTGRTLVGGERGAFETVCRV